MPAPQVLSNFPDRGSGGRRAPLRWETLPVLFLLGEGIEILAAMQEEHRRPYDRAVARAPDTLNPIDHVIAAVLKRSIANAKAFLLLMDSGNEFAAMPLIRLQLDSVLRISAFRLVDDPYALAKHMIEGEVFHKYKNPTRTVDLCDHALRTPLEAKYEYINELYETTSGYVHLSQHHLIRVVKDWDNLNREEEDKVEFGPVEELPPWKQSDQREAMVFFCVATRFLLDETEAVQSAERFQ
jgi:hypothetical protein